MASGETVSSTVTTGAVDVLTVQPARLNEAAAARVTEIKVKAGDKVTVGQTILSVEGETAQPAQRTPSPPPGTGTNTTAEPSASQVEPAAPQPQVARTPAPERALQDDRLAQSVEGASPGPAAYPSRIKKGSNVFDIGRGPRTLAGRDRPPAPAAPSVRRLARELGVDINQIAGTGANGRISQDDVKAHTKGVVESSRASAAT